jgi:outer membrane autotransporter protein
MGEMVFQARVRRRVRALWLGLTLSAIVAQLGHAQILSPAFPNQANPLTALPGQNLTQQTMGQSINVFCPTVASIAMTTVATPGQKDLAGLCSAMLGNGLTVQGKAPGVFGSSFGLDASGLNGALSQLNGGAELNVPTSQASIVQTTQTSRQTSAIEARLSQLRDWPAGTAVAGAQFPRMGQVAALDTQDPAGQILLAQNQPLEFTYSTGPLGVFANGFGQFGSRDPTTSVNGYSFNNAGFVAGVDYRFTPRLVAGLAFGYSQSNTNFDTSAVSAPGQFLSGNLFQGNIYATYSVTDAFYLNGIGSVGGGNNNSQRHIVLPNTVQGLPGDRISTGSFGSNIQGVTVAGGYALPFGPLVVTPIARFLYQHTGVDAMTENGALGADLAFGSSSVNTVLSFLGADAQYVISTPFGPLYPLARFHWAHQYSPGNTAVSVGYSNDPTLISTFILPGAQTSRNYFDLGVGVGLQLSGNSSAFINYDAILGINNTTYNSFTAGVRFTF